MIRSMTGFGAAEGSGGGARVSVEIRSVNHRFFSPSIKLPAALSRWEPEVREVLRRAVSRGHVTVSAKIDASQSAEAVIDESRFDAYVRRLRDLKDRYALDGPIDLATVLRLPDVITGETIGDGTVGELTSIVERAVVELSNSRAAEGHRLGGFLNDRIALIDDAVKRLADRAPTRMVEQRDRLKATVAELAAGVHL